MCDEYYDERRKVSWRALADESDLERDEEKSEIESVIHLPPLEPAKGNRKALVR
jgi:hypothetical protein